MVISKEDLDNPLSMWFVDLMVRTNCHHKIRDPREFENVILKRMIVTGLEVSKLNEDFVTICSAEKYAKLTKSVRGVGALKIVEIVKIHKHLGYAKRD